MLFIILNHHTLKKRLPKVIRLDYLHMGALYASSQLSNMLLCLQPECVCDSQGAVSLQLFSLLCCFLTPVTGPDAPALHDCYNHLPTTHPKQQDAPGDEEMFMSVRVCVHMCVSSHLHSCREQVKWIHNVSQEQLISGFQVEILFCKKYSRSRISRNFIQNTFGHGKCLWIKSTSPLCDEGF